MKYVTVDMNKDKFRGIPWKMLGDFGKRKFENLLILKNAKEKIQIRYVQTIKR